MITRNNVGDQTLENAIQEESKYNGTSDFDGSENFKTKYPAVQAGWLYKTYIPSQNEAGKINYSSNYKNMKATEYLLDSSIWNVSYKKDKAEWAIGAPTLELLVEVYKKYKDKEIIIDEPSGVGYVYNDELVSQNSIGRSDKCISKVEKSKNIFNHGEDYWIACPGNNYNDILRYVDSDYASVGGGTYSQFSGGIRPVVCLKSSVILKESSDGATYTIE